MLVLTRKLQETIHICENITITIVRIQGNTVRVGIEAPRDTRVLRGEVLARDQVELTAAGAETPAANPSDSAVVLKRRAPLARLTANKPRLRVALPDGRPDSQAALRDACAAASPDPSLTC